jgi:hypothetical protein
MTQELLGDHPIAYKPFRDEDTKRVFSELDTPHFQELAVRKKFKFINQTLLDLIQAVEEPCFLLPAVLEFIECVNQKKILIDPYHFSDFEFWLNRFSKLSEVENRKVRAKIVGKWIPREEYQAFFPVGTGTMFSGTHFVAAHAAPDIDTTIASFWGWVDAFGAKLAEGIHQWSLPGQCSDSHFTLLFHKLLSPAVFKQLARTSSTLTLTALDLVTQKEMFKVNEQTLTSAIDRNYIGKAIVLVDDDDFFKGDWRSSDAEQVRQVVALFTAVIRVWEKNIHATLIAIFAKKEIHLADVQKAIEPIFSALIKDAEPVHDYGDKQKGQLNTYLTKILNVEQGINCSFLELGHAIDAFTDKKFHSLHHALHSLADEELYDSKQQLIEDRPKIFAHLEKIIQDLNSLIVSLRTSIDRLSVMIQVKQDVLGIPSRYVTLKSDVEEIRSKMDAFEHLTVVIPEEDGRCFPVGIIHAQDLRRPVLGTVSLRDFSNEQETKMASYLEVISVIDHHKTNLKTNCAAFFLIADVQSCNTLVAEQAFLINARYGRSPSQRNHEHTGAPYFVHQDREFVEYLCFLYAILDDTDLLTKVTARDVECVARLLNRMKSLATRADNTVISLDDIPKNGSFPKAAALRILQNRDMYSLYKTIYEFKEQEVEAQLIACAEDHPSTIFADTKEQNGCCSIGQTKIFKKNYQFFKDNVHAFRQAWLQGARRTHESKPQIDFYLHMISTIASADEVFSGHVGNWEHQDEMWLWIPPTQRAMEHLVGFLNSLYPTPIVQDTNMSVELSTSDNAHELSEAFAQNFPKVPRRAVSSPNNLPITILRFKAGAINSRKAQISPYLPRLIP